MKKLILKIGIALLSAVYAVMKLFPQDKKLILFLSRERNTPGIDFLLLEKQLKQDFEGCRTRMLCKRFVAAESGLAGIIGYGFHVLKQMHYIARARVVVLDTYCIPVSLFRHRDELLVLQIWHAIGSMKKFGYAMLDKEEGSSRDTASVMKMHRGYDYMFISSKSFIKDYLEGFDTTEDKIIEIPLPKADLLTDKEYAEKKKDEFFALYPEAKGRKNILYCPTFRKDGSPLSAVSELAARIDPDKYNLIFQPHPLDAVKELPTCVITTKLPTYEVIFAADYVISDYSSVIYEAGLAGKPIFAYAYDWDEYSGKREINFDIQNEFPGIFTADAGKIIQAIQNDDFDINAQRAFIAKNVTMPQNATCAEALSRFILSHLK